MTTPFHITGPGRYRTHGGRHEPARIVVITRTCPERHGDNWIAWGGYFEDEPACPEHWKCDGVYYYESVEKVDRLLIERLPDEPNSQAILDSSRPMFADAKAGDRVYSFTRGWGVISEIREGTGYGIYVSFKKNTRETYTFEGRRFLEDRVPSLFWDEVYITPPPQPKRKVTKTDEAWKVHLPSGNEALFFSEANADACVSQSEGAFKVKLTGAYEVEE